MGQAHMWLRAVVVPLTWIMLAGGADQARADSQAAAAVATAAPDGGASAGWPAVNGLYPLWEHTAMLHPRGAAQIGLSHAQYSLGRVQLGVQPAFLFYGTINGQVKAELWRGQRTRVAVETGVYRLPVAAEGRSVGQLHGSGFTNPYAPVWLAPLSCAQSVVISPRLAVHAATTVLGVASHDQRDRHVSFGESVIVEWRAGEHWGAWAHGGVEGWPVMAQSHAGLSLGYRGQHVRAQAGYGRRWTWGEGSTPLFLFDVAVLLP